MAKQRIPLDWISIDRSSPDPVYRQIARQIEHAVNEDWLAPGTYLPASRTLAAALGVSRLTVLSAYELLVADGFLEAIAGSGTRVASDLAAPRSVDGAPRPDRFRRVPRGLPAGTRGFTVAVSGERTGCIPNRHPGPRSVSTARLVHVVAAARSSRRSRHPRLRSSTRLSTPKGNDRQILDVISWRALCSVANHHGRIRQGGSESRLLGPRQAG